jgi:hypothetical protein
LTSRQCRIDLERQLMESTQLAKSPLTIIAIFAATIEASALASLPLLESDNQYIYTWFLIGFPPFLTLLFFVTLNFNNRALYSPSDFTDQENFLKTQNTSKEAPAGVFGTATDYNQLAIAARAASKIAESAYLPLPGGLVHVIDCQHVRDRHHCFELIEKISALSRASDQQTVDSQVVILVSSDRLGT